MAQLINLATIEFSNEILHELDIGNVLQNFANSYRKLDELKKFRTEYERKNALIRWWHNDKLRHAQLDSADVQAEFSKTIGQLMMISIMQAKTISGQQAELNAQQSKLKIQANGIAEHAGELQKQHQVLAEQAAELKKLVDDNIALHGVTEDGARKLIKIANEAKTTKEEMLQQFAARAKDIEVLRNEVLLQLKFLSEQVNDQVRLNADQTQSAIVTLQQETQEALISNASALRDEHEILRQANNLNISNLEDGLVQFQEKISERMRRLGRIVTGVAITVLVMLGGMAHLLKWI